MLSITRQARSVEHAGGRRLYLDADAAHHVAGQELDGESDQHGRVQLIRRDPS